MRKCHVVAIKLPALHHPQCGCSHPCCSCFLFLSELNPGCSRHLFLLRRCWLDSESGFLICVRQNLHLTAILLPWNVTGDLIVDVVWILFIADDLTLTRPVQILRQRQVQTDNNGLRWVNPPGFGHFILWTPNSVIILNRPQKQTWIQRVLVNCVFHLHPKSLCLCVGQCPRYRWPHTPCGRGENDGDAEVVFTWRPD